MNIKDAVVRAICANMGMCPRGSCADFTCCEAAQRTADEVLETLIATVGAEDEANGRLLAAIIFMHDMGESHD